MKTERIIIVEDDPVARKVLSAKLAHAGYEVVEVAEANAALLAAQEKMPDLMILDLTLVGSEFNGITDGFGLLHWLRYRLGGCNFPVIIHTADTSPNVDARASELGISAVFRKGDSLDQLLATVCMALAQASQTIHLKSAA